MSTVQSLTDEAAYRQWSDEDTARQERKAFASYGRVRHPELHTPVWAELVDNSEADR